MTTQTFPQVTGISRTDRIAVIDALRGFSLIGIIVAHCANQYLAGPTPPSAGTLNLFSPLDFALDEAAGYLAFGKFFTVFSFLFGLSFAIQMDRGPNGNSAQNGRPFVGRTVWRVVILFAIDFTHSLFYSDDILRTYAVLSGLQTRFCGYARTPAFFSAVTDHVRAVGIGVYRIYHGKRGAGHFRADTGLAGRCGSHGARRAPGHAVGVLRGGRNAAVLANAGAAAAVIGGSGTHGSDHLSDRHGVWRTALSGLRAGVVGTPRLNGLRRVGAGIFRAADSAFQLVVSPLSVRPGGVAVAQFDVSQGATGAKKSRDDGNGGLNPGTGYQNSRGIAVSATEKESATDNYKFFTGLWSLF